MPRSRFFAGAFLVSGLTALAQHAHAEPCDLSMLKWLAGTWHNTENPTGAQERWAIAPGDVLMGTAWEFPPGKSGYAEITTIRKDGAAVSMLLRHFDGGLSRAWEDREAPMVFTATECGQQTVSFAGQGEHTGEHMSYTRKGEELHIVADFLHQGKSVHVEWHMLKGGD
jgi:hypothetical protein